ncbi:hypothetical protein VTK56DRAFT_9 [Thermocarpiscus australiensis]
MTSVVLLRICFVSACANALFNKRNSHPLGVHKATVVARRTTRSTSSRCEHCLCRKYLAAPVSFGRRRRVPWSAYHLECLRKPSRSFSLHSLHSLPLHRAEAAAHTATEKGEMDQMASLQRSLDETTLNAGQAAHERRHAVGSERGDETKPRRFPDEPLTSPPSHADELIETRSTRSASTTSRSTNRLSLTLPIVPPNAYPSRPAPASSTTPAFPPTPLDTPSLMSPVDPTDFITAIAAQERRVLELREELSRAESDLARLKKQYATHEAYKKRADRRNLESMRGLGPAADLLDETAIRRNVELDRRKALLGQQGQQTTMERSRRRVFTGSHTRTLSLLSPTKPTGGFPVHEDQVDSSRPDSTSRYAPVSSAVLAKRASWAPRSTQTSGVKQIAEDLKAGLWTFMEDLRQATVGDEPITGQGPYLRGKDGSMRSTVNGSLSPSNNGGDHDTIRATAANSRSRAISAFEETPSADSRAALLEKREAEIEEQEDKSSDAEASKQTRRLQRSKTEATKPTKRFSWTPLTIDSYDDNDWSNWDSPSSSSPRWSGTTVNGDIIPSIPEKRDENETPLKKKASKSRIAARSPSPTTHKLEDLLPPVLNRLTPSNIKRTAVDFMKEWERSLSPPDTTSASSPVAVGKEKGM